MGTFTLLKMSQGRYTTQTESDEKVTQQRGSGKMEQRQKAASHVRRTEVRKAEGFFFYFYFQNSGSIESVLQRLS